jgi:hypothetical protein
MTTWTHDPQINHYLAFVTPIDLPNGSPEAFCLNKLLIEKLKKIIVRLCKDSVSQV